MNDSVADYVITELNLFFPELLLPPRGRRNQIGQQLRRAGGGETAGGQRRLRPRPGRRTDLRVQNGTHGHRHQMVRVPFERLGVHVLILIHGLVFLSTTEYKCVVFYRRSGDIIEIQEGLPTDIEAEACSPGYMNQDQLPFTSLLSM